MFIRNSYKNIVLNNGMITCTSNILFNLGHHSLYNEDGHVRTSYVWRYYNKRENGGITLRDRYEDSIL